MSLTAEHHEILKMLRTHELDTKTHDALSILIASTHDHTDRINALRLMQLLAIVERGVEHIMTMIIQGPDGEVVDAPRRPPPDSLMFLLIHLQWVLDVARDEPPQPTIATALHILKTRFNLPHALPTATELAAETCPDPMCRIHYKWWNAS